MRILHVIASVDPTGGGPIEGTRLSVLAMRELGHETEVVSLDSRTAPLAEFPCPVHPLGKWFTKYGYTPRLARWLANNGHRFDAAVLHGLWNHSSIGGWQGLRRAGVPYALFTHGMMDPWFSRKYPFKHRAKQLFWRLWQGRALHDAGAVLFTCEEERRLASGAFSGWSYTERVVAYGTAEPPREQPGEVGAFRQLIPSLGEHPYLLFMSRIHPKKGCDLLVEAFADVAATFPDIDLVIAGPDQVGWRRMLEALAARHGVAERIHWPGMLSGDAKYGALRHAEAMILPSHQENFGIVVAEALACRRPVLISNKVNIWREVEEAGAGLVAEDTREGTRSLLERFLALAPEERAAMGEAGVALYRQRFTALAAARDLERVLAEIAADHARGSP